MNIQYLLPPSYNIKMFVETRSIASTFAKRQKAMLHKATCREELHDNWMIAVDRVYKKYKSEAGHIRLKHARLKWVFEPIEQAIVYGSRAKGFTALSAF